jgi:hypothetical protein
VAAAGEIGALAVAIGLSVRPAREEKQVTTYRSARWADLTEVHQAKLLGDDGVVLAAGTATICAMMDQSCALFRPKAERQRRIKMLGRTCGTDVKENLARVTLLRRK